MRTDIHFYGMAPMREVGANTIEPTDRRSTNAEVVECYSRLCHWAQVADNLGYDTMWLTEHHFQYEGYEVTPNLILFGVHLAGLTRRIRFGQLFNIVPQWHPLRLAEDFAMGDILTGGRLVFGVGRGTVPREAQTLGAVVASGDNAMSKEADRINREQFEEAMDVIREAWTKETFSFSGKHFTYPPPGIPDRGSTVSHLTLVPRPVSERIEIFQPVTSPATLSYVARQGFTAVFAMGPYDRVKGNWDRFAEASEAEGRPLAPGENRCLQLPVHVGTTTEQALRGARSGHDEFVKFLAPYGRFKSFSPDSTFDFRPTVEESRRSGGMVIGSVEEVADTLGRWRDLLDLRHLILFPDLPGLSREALDEQLHLLAEEVLPRLGVRLGTGASI